MAFMKKKAGNSKKAWRVISAGCFLLCLIFGGLAVKSQRNILVVLFNSNYVTQADIKSINRYCGDFNKRMIDVKDYNDAAEVYSALKSKYSHFYNSIKGVQIFGTRTAVPSFRFDFKYQFVSEDGADDYYKPFYSDFCYSNFSADAKIFKEPLNVYDMEKNKVKFDFKPGWQVARVLLGRGKIAKYIAKQEEFKAENTDVNRLPISAFCCTVLNEESNLDDCCYFLKERLDKECKLVDVPYSLYGNKLGKFEIKDADDGEFSVANLEDENKAGARNFMIFTHGLKDKIIQHAALEAQEKRLDTLPAELKQGCEYLASLPATELDEEGKIVKKLSEVLDFEDGCMLYKIPKNQGLGNECNVLVMRSKSSLKNRCRLLELQDSKESKENYKIWVVPCGPSLFNKKEKLELSASEYLRLEGEGFSEARLVIKAPTIKNINKILKHNYYTLNTWCCNLARDLDLKNMISKMMQGRCIDAIAATSELTNNGTDKTAPILELEKNNPFFFWYEFFKNTARGQGRCQSFTNAKKAYAKAILNNKEQRNYQYNLHNILSLHYFGLI